MLEILSLYRHARRIGVDVTLLTLVGIRLRKADVADVLRAVILARENRFELRPQDAEAHWLQAGDPVAVARAAAARVRRGQSPQVERLMACERAGLDVERLVADGLDVSRLPGGFDPGPRYSRHRRE